MSEPDPDDSAMEAAERLKDDLKEIADSNLPFSTDAQVILSEIKDNE